MTHKEAYAMQPTHRAIQRLPEEVVGKIAAGEVVESPADAVRKISSAVQFARDYPGRLVLGWDRQQA